MRHHRLKDKNDISITYVAVSSVNAMECSKLKKRDGKTVDPLLPQKKPVLNKQSKTTKNNLTHQGHTHTPDSPQLYACTICSKQFKIKSYLYQHLVTHDNERKHKCSMCTKVFKRLAGLNQVRL